MTDAISMGVFSPADAREIKRRVLQSNRKIAGLPDHGSKDEPEWHFVIFKEDLAPVCDSTDEYTQAQAAVMMYVSGEDSLGIEEVLPEAQQITVTNRSPYVSFMSGDVVLVRRMTKEWVVVGTAMKRLQAVMQADLTAAVSTIDDPSTAPAKILFRKPSGDMKLTDIEVTIVNRFVNISVSAGTYVKIEDMSGEWQLYAADCPGESSFSSSSIGSSC